ncbi:Asp-tRNA(Asn)/Glu-tRNA(Gln) amidotransferase subunit GatB [Patescibacteria group bacterium]|nr:Asp-tRNA(Asn)/Glu-tRNA(Gln) amidotransferase subunit GatB [Patescibacteria group bacterium]MBU1015490.1 Asp-tRNA(Asn)/Glu-tRNA(Gln) amidotransferase subunit GatB [Patescibacteria group bacterium]MBU1685413.1 Asp-tRNA(Asn)/Glu-tRNA(Gln) amidotransferase subunit GatB [Patescibacteria group bacterium]MBU1938374.1 Asp-tRNA(Asn)/Glu-tRNA(Gln) amidotransferase subunit GatB [Patescibacteria group bacterium]
MEFEPVIGLEVHCRISSKTKMFCRCSNDIFNAKPNTHVCPVCMGFPGMLPLLNEEVVKKGILGALALGCEIPGFSKMDRKSYFYPDLPKGFQISQYDLPVSVKGGITIALSDGSTKRIGITRLHLEDDAGKLTHTAGGTLVDFNRSGTPLMEIVSEPDLRSTEEASLYARQLQKIMRYVGASDADMEKGMMRFDINVSLRPRGQKEFGVRSETKNLNSFRSLEKALDYEIKRQTEILESGGTVVQETRGWDDNKEVTISQRGKEEAADYRYFPEPDIPPIVVTREMVEELKKQIPELHDKKADRYQSELGLPAQDAHQLSHDAALAAYFEAALEVSGEPKKTSNWLLSELMALLNADGLSISESKLAPENLGKLVKLIEDGAITGKIAKDIFKEIYEGNLDPEKAVEEKGLKVMSDTGELEKICQQIIDRNPQIVADFKGGKEKALSGLVGQVMGVTGGSANPKSVNEILRKLLAESTL